jgi:outer membrane protein assembly factor BamB
MNTRSYPWRSETAPALRKRHLFSSLALSLVVFTATASSLAFDYPQWRGPQRDGVSAEKGLLKEWPKDGPALVWQVQSAGSGYSTPAVVGDRIYLLGNEGLDREFVAAFSAKDGKQIWSTDLGKVGNPKQQPSFPAARSTPTVDGNLVYALSSDGDLACLEAKTGKKRWQKNLRTDFGGKPGEWAYAESPLVDGKTLVCTPGGAEATLLALDKETGEVQWKCALPEADEANYSSIIVINDGGVKQYVQMVQKGLVGVDAKTGKFLWRFGKAVSRYGCNIPTPVAHEAAVFCAAAGTGAGLVKIKAEGDKWEAEEVYFSPKLPTAIGGSVKVGDYLYGTTGKALLCVDFKSGEVKWDAPSLGAASICYADGLLYLHGENGEVSLIEATPQEYREKGRFNPPNQPKRSQQMEKAWAYPVVANGRLYLRDHGSLWCYDIRAR